MAELGLAIVGVVGSIDVCIKWGNALVSAYKDFKNADARLNELTVRVELCWNRIANQLLVTRELETTMSSDDRDLQERVLCILGGKLDIATNKVGKFTRKKESVLLTSISALRFVMLKNAMNETVTELELWRGLYEPSWFHLIKLAPARIEVTLKRIESQSDDKKTVKQHKMAKKLRDAFHEPPKSTQQISSTSTTAPMVSTTTTKDLVFIAKESLSECQTHDIPYCSALFAQRPQNAGYLIIDPTIGGAVQEADAADFARRFKNADPFVFSLLSCKGVVRKYGLDRTMSFVFRVPAEYNVVWGLRQLLLSGIGHNSLSDRLQVARNLVSAVYYIHLYGFVHKNIRPETILNLARPGDTGIPTKAFLVGFQVIRNADGATYPMPKSSWERNLYRHPTRQGNDISYYVMQHDMYSLGVCLLEIGLWSSFVTYGPHWAAQPSPTLALTQDSPELKNPKLLKDHLVALSQNTLRGKMGTRYAEVVETCLTCLDEDNEDFGPAKEFTQEGGSAMVGTRYIEKVLGIMNSLSF